ncbi:VOC family protein [Mucilaginibacter sp.]|uniref:VOC family protein n=1 Tax=Mucilaginibacter sp. TaxID=1882438 RepID=UPI00260321C1|nr:VOC family protein [Mucilaginibacter sp.]MDB5029426.1 bleomycin resistance protein [Mucilaginibacter sp.]
METKTAFAPVLTIPNGTTDIDFYKKAFNAVENFCLRNDDGSIHVAELVIDGAVFHVHEITQFSRTIPANAGRGTVNIGLFVEDVYAVFNQAIAAGATQSMPVTDFEYGYRQGELIDSFGHKWIIQCRIPVSPDWMVK